MKSDKPRVQGERRHTYEFAEKQSHLIIITNRFFTYLFCFFASFHFSHYTSISRYFICFFVVPIFHLLTSFSFFSFLPIFDGWSVGDFVILPLFEYAKANQRKE